MSIATVPTGEQQAQANHRALRERIARLDDQAIDLILRDARSHYAWQDRKISEDEVRILYDIVANGPTSMNSCPARFVFVTSEQAKQRLSKALKPKNVDKMLGAPVTAIVAHDPEFWRQLPKLFPHEDRRDHFSDKPELAEVTAFRNGTLQGCYLMIAARGHGIRYWRHIGILQRDRRPGVLRRHNAKVQLPAEYRLRRRARCFSGYRGSGSMRFVNFSKVRSREDCMVAIKLKTNVKLRLKAECPSHARSDLSVRDLEFSIDEPTERGGTNTGPTPTDTAIAALIGCVNVIGSKCADNLGVDLGHLTISATCDFDRRGVTLTEEIDVPFQRIELSIIYDGSASARPN